MSGSNDRTDSIAFTSRLPARASLEQLRKQAKELLKLYRAGDAAAAERFKTHVPQAFAPILADAQFVLAREHGFESWPRLVRYVETDHTSERVKEFEQRAADILAAYGGDASALERLNDLFPRTLTTDELRQSLQQRLNLLRGAAAAAGEFILNDAQLIIARHHGFESWAKFVLSFSQPAGDPRKLKFGMSSSLPFYRIDWQTNTIEPGPLMSSRDWDTVIDVMKELQLTGLNANGLLTNKALERLAELDHVTHLGFGGTKHVSDEGLKHLARMPQLQHLELSEYPGGQITDRGLDALRYLRELRSFQMTWQGGVTDEGIANLRFCDQLETVDLLGTPTGDGAIRALAGKGKLRKLKTGCQLSDAGLLLLHEIPSFKKWQEVGEVKYGLLSFEPDATNLLIDGPFTGKGLAGLRGLEGIFGLSIFWHTRLLCGEDLKALAVLPNLGFLGCQGELCNDDAMRHIAAIPQLRMLMAQGTVATDEGFTALSRSQSIEHVWGRECPNLKSRGFAALTSMPSLVGLAVSCKFVDDEALSTLPRFPALKELMPMDVADAGFRHVGRCHNLEHLVMMYCRDTTDVATEHIAPLPNLKRYYAGYTKITDRGLELLGGMQSLERLEFEGCERLTDQGLPSLARLPNLREVSIGASPKVTREGMTVFPTHVRVKYW
jgi:hypothetical protein